MCHSAAASCATSCVTSVTFALATSALKYGVMQGKQNRAQFSNWLCYELSGVCKTKPPPLAKGRKPGPAFQVVDPKEAEMEKMLAGMKVAPSDQTLSWPLPVPIPVTPLFKLGPID